MKTKITLVLEIPQSINSLLEEARRWESRNKLEYNDDEDSLIADYFLDEQLSFIHLETPIVEASNGND